MFLYICWQTGFALYCVKKSYSVVCVGEPYSSDMDQLLSVVVPPASGIYKYIQYMYV